MIRLANLECSCSSSFSRTCRLVCKTAAVGFLKALFQPKELLSILPPENQNCLVSQVSYLLLKRAQLFVSDFPGLVFPHGFSLSSVFRLVQTERLDHFLQHPQAEGKQRRT